MKTQNFGMKNTYTIYKFVDGKKRVLAHFHNLVTARMKQQLTADSGVRIHSIWFGDGSAEPSESDTALTHPLWTFSWNYGNIISTERPELSQDGTWNILCTAKIDASDAYVGTVSEIGLYITVSSSGLAMGTHALIKDAEGNPMTITKTDTEVLYVDIHLQYQLSSSSEFEWSPWYYYLLGSKSASQSWPQIPVLSSMQIVMLRAYPDLMSNGNIIGNRVLLTNSYDASRHVLTCSNGRFGTENQPTQDYVNAVGIIPGFWGRPSYDYYRPSVPMGFWKFPNPDLFPNTTLSDMRVGTGDGVKVDFTPPLNLWVKDTERVFVDGVLQVRDVDYTCDHRNNLSELYSLNPSIFCNLKNELVRQDSTATSGMGFHPLKGGCNDVASGSNNERRIYIVWDKIDLIVTKSVSRFARNTVDSLTTIRQLKENGIEVYFEKENIWTFDGKGEVLLTIMSSLAQEESRSISENCTWGQRKRFADGKVTVPFKRFLGYDRGEDGNLVINPEQAKVVKRIYGMFLKGMTPHGIAKTLTDEGIPTPAGKHQWGQTTIKSILSNEKYKGDALLQKTFCEDFLTKKMKTNQGEVPQYYVENNHEAIIDPETFEMVQRELARRTKGKNRHSGVHLLSGRIKCGDCGGWYGSKVWHSPEKCKRTVWQCNQKYKNEVRCTTPYLDEASVKERFTVAVNQLLAGRDAAITAYEMGMARTLDTTELEAQQQELLSEMEVLNGMIQQMIRQNATVAQDQTEYKQRFDSLSQKFKDTEVKKDAVAQQISDILDRRGTMEDFLRILKQQDGEVTAFSEKLWCGLLDFATSYADGRLTFTFKNGSTFEG